MSFAFAHQRLQVLQLALLAVEQRVATGAADPLRLIRGDERQRAGALGAVQLQGSGVGRRETGLVAAVDGETKLVGSHFAAKEEPQPLRSVFDGRELAVGSVEIDKAMFGIRAKVPGNVSIRRGGLRNPLLRDEQDLAARQFQTMTGGQRIVRGHRRLVADGFLRQHVEPALSLSQPLDAVSRKPQVPLVPDASCGMLVLHAADDFEMLLLEASGESARNPGAGLDQVGDLTVVFQPLVLAGQDRVAEFADRHQGRAELELDGTAARGTIRDPSLHRATPPQFLRG